MRYGVGVGAEGFIWSGTATIHNKQEWPDWYPPAEMLARKPELKEHMVQLQSGLGMKGGPENPIGARAMYLWQGNKDTLYRIHGTNEPGTIGHNVSSGCIRLTNDDVTDLYNRTPVGTKVVVLPTAGSARRLDAVALYRHRGTTRARTYHHGVARLCPSLRTDRDRFLDVAGLRARPAPAAARARARSGRRPRLGGA